MWSENHDARITCRSGCFCGDTVRNRIPGPGRSTRLTKPSLSVNHLSASSCSFTATVMQVNRSIPGMKSPLHSVAILQIIAASETKMFLYLLAGIICLLVACALVVLWHFRRTVALSSPTGPFAVGRVSYQWVDPSPLETFSKSRTPDARWWCGFG